MRRKRFLIQWEGRISCRTGRIIYQMFSRSSFVYRWLRSLYIDFSCLPFKRRGSLVKRRDNHAIGRRKIKKISPRSIFELIQPNTCANLSQIHSIPFATSGIKIDTSAMPRAILAKISAARVYSFANKTQAITRNPVTMTSMVLYLSCFCTVKA